MLGVTTVYVHDNDKTQTVSCSDRSQGVMEVENNDSAPLYDFRFYGHAHPEFFLDQNQFHDGEQLTVDDIMNKEQFQLKFV